MTNRVKEFRKAKGLRQRDLGALVDMDSAHLSRIENGHVEPGVATAKKLAAALDTTVEELFDLVEEPAA